MSTSTLALLGVLSALLSFIGFAYYIHNILRGKTKPERSSWWIWTILMVVAFAAQAAAGSTWSLFLTGALLLGNLIIALMSLRHGYGRFKNRDYIALIVTFVGLYLWKITENPLAALLIIICVDFLGNLLTILKSWRAPYSENMITWILTTLGAVFGNFAVGSLNVTRQIFPIYVVIANLIVIGAIYSRRKWRMKRITEGLQRRKR